MKENVSHIVQVKGPNEPKLENLRPDIKQEGMQPVKRLLKDAI